MELALLFINGTLIPIALAVLNFAVKIERRLARLELKVFGNQEN